MKNKYKEALKAYDLKEENSDCEICPFLNNGCPYTGDNEFKGNCLAGRLLNELIDQETPHSLAFYGDGYDPTDGELVYDTAVCDCQREFEIEYEEHYKYCPSCGRKLDWGEDNEDE